MTASWAGVAVLMTASAWGANSTKVLKVSSSASVFNTYVFGVVDGVTRRGDVEDQPERGVGQDVALVVGDVAVREHQVYRV